MARINLLPWREELRKQRKREFGIQLVGAIILAALGALYWYLQVDGQIQHQNTRNDMVRREISKLDEAIREIKELEQTRARLIQRMDVIQNLQASRPLAVRMFDQLVSTVPEGVYLDSLAQTGNRLELVGRTQSNARVSAYLRNIEASEDMGVPQLQVIESDEKEQTGWGMFKMTTLGERPQVEIVAEEPPAKGKKGKKSKTAKDNQRK